MYKNVSAGVSNVNNTLTLHSCFIPIVSSITSRKSRFKLAKSAKCVVYSKQVPETNFTQVIYVLVILPIITFSYYIVALIQVPCIIALYCPRRDFN